jgi:hypothetical protein
MSNGDGIAEGLARLQEWAEPIVFDRLLDVYVKRLGVGADAWTLARLHARTWRAAVHGDDDRFQTVRWDLSTALNEHRLVDADAAAADAEIIAELLEIVMARHHRSARTARSYHLALIAIAGRLTPVVATKRAA